MESRASRTALRVALRRAAHQLIDDLPLVFPDPLAIRILGAEAAGELERTPDATRRPFSAALRAWMVVRARFAEDVLATGVLHREIRQALVLGAGLDTFAYRNLYPGLRVFEVDHPATQAWKRECLHSAGIEIPAQAVLVPVDFERQRLREELLASGFEGSQATATSWLGVVPYLTIEAFRSTVGWLGTLPAGSSVVFDYGQPREVLPEQEQRMRDSMAARVADAGEPFRLFFTPEAIAAELGSAGFAVVEDLGGPALTERYLAGRLDGLQLKGQSGRLCHARVE